MEMVEIGRFIASLAFVIGLILAVAWIAKRVGLERKLNLKASQFKRIEIIDRMMIDPRRRLVLIRRDGREHLLLLGTTHDLVIESYDAPPEQK